MRKEIPRLPADDLRDGAVTDGPIVWFSYMVGEDLVLGDLVSDYEPWYPDEDDLFGGLMLAPRLASDSLTWSRAWSVQLAVASCGLASSPSSLTSATDGCERR